MKSTKKTENDERERENQKKSPRILETKMLGGTVRSKVKGTQRDGRKNTDRKALDKPSG